MATLTINVLSGGIKRWIIRVKLYFPGWVDEVTTVTRGADEPAPRWTDQLLLPTGFSSMAMAFSSATCSDRVSAD